MTIAISVMALLIAVSSLIWQVFSWRHSGPRVRVRGCRGVMYDKDKNENHYVAVVASNKGRSSTYVQNFGLTDGNIWMEFNSLPTNDEFAESPALLEPGYQQVRGVKMEEVARFCNTNRIEPEKLQAQVFELDQKFTHNLDSKTIAMVKLYLNKSPGDSISFL